MRIRVADGEDREEIYRVHWSAFGEDERDLVAKLAVDLLKEEGTPPVVSLVAEADDKVVGHTAFSPVAIEGESWHGYILAPLGIMPEYQNRGIASQLVEDGMQRLSEMGADIVFVYGDPKYYGRFGFSAEVGKRYVPPYQLQYPFGWQAVALKDITAGNSPSSLVCVTSLCNPALW